MTEAPPIAPQTVRAEPELAEAVAFRIGRPVDAWAVVAALESEGWRDVDAEERFGEQDLFELAETIYPECVAYAAARPGAQEARQVESRLVVARRFAASYLRGLTYALPVTGQVMALVWLGYSLWASIRLTEGGATMIGLSTIASFVVTAGFVQALAHETSRLLGHELGGQARRVAFRIARLGAWTVLVTGLIGFAANLIIPFYPLLLGIVGLSYYLMLGWLWLALALLYVQERLVAVGMSTTLGILPVWGAVGGLGWNIHVAHVLGLAVAIALALVWVSRTLGHPHLAESDGPEPPLPRASTTFHATLPYVGYGILYFSVLFADRVVAWSAAGADPLAYPVWFRTDYELGMDWALVVLFIMLAALPFSVRRMGGQLHDLGPASTTEEVTNAMRGQYLRHLSLLIGCGILGIAVVWAGGLAMERHGPELLEPMFAPGVPRYVFIVASLGYFLLAIGLMNGLVFLAQGQTGRVLRPLVLALGLDLSVGFVVTRWMGYEHAVIGLCVGALWFAAATTRSALLMLRKADYYSYVAY
ncbi:MAG: hypothetical protein AAF170_13810 [Bacteroidota bacterium]